MFDDISSFFKNLFDDRKYRPILLSLLVLSVVLVVVLIANYQFAKRTTIATEHMDLIGDISDDTLFIALGAQQLPRLMKDDPDSAKSVLKTIQAQTKEVDDYLEQVLEYEQKEDKMTQFAELWKVYGPKVRALTPESSTKDFTELANYAFEKQADIWDFMDEGYDTYLEESLQQAHYTKYTQIFTFLVLVSFLLVFVGYALRRMQINDKLLEKAHKQTDDIMQTVKEGLFLIDDNLIIAEQYSKSTEMILNQQVLAGRTLLDLLKGVISEKDMQATKLFVEQLYNPWVVEELITDLNPLQSIKVHSVNSAGEYEDKYLDFNFLRVVDEKTDTIKKVFVSVVDITKSIKLQENLEKQKRQHDYELEMIASILQVDSHYLNNFIHSTRSRIEKINDILKANVDINTTNLKAKASQLFRHMHSIKGDASALKLEAFVSIAEKEEDKLKVLMERSALKGDDFLSFTVGLNELLDLVNYVSKLLEKFKMFGSQIQNASTNPQHWKDYFINYANDIAKRHGKRIQLTVSGFDELGENAPNFGTYRDVAIQLLKNAVVHGIETPEERARQGKSEIGTIRLELTPHGNDLTLLVEDDGKGIDVARLRQKALELGIITPEQAQTLPVKSLYGLMFKSGVSTAEKHSEDAGRGVGMDIVYDVVRTGQGKIDVNSQPAEFTRMTINFPQTV